MTHFIEGIVTGVIATIGGTSITIISAGRYFKRHPEKLYRAVVIRKKSNGPSRSN